MTAQTTTSGLALVAGHFEPPPMAVPNSTGECFKIEQVEYRDPDRRTAKLVWWFGPDEDRDPHNHPWRFLADEEAVARADELCLNDDGRDAFIRDVTGADILAAYGKIAIGGVALTSLAGVSFISEIRAGGYTSRTWSHGGGVVTDRYVRAGDVVAYPFDEYHIVKDVLPGTRTRMICGPATPGNAWGYLDPSTGRRYPAEKDPTFMERMIALNPWRRSPS
jgi:hypothetical protein